MPNWCYTSIHIEGPKPDLDRFMSEIEVPKEVLQKEIEKGDVFMYGRPDLDFTRLYPTPEDLQLRDVIFVSTGDPSDDDRAEREALEKRYASNLEKYGYRSWYDWNCVNWGTKWSPKITDLEMDHLGDTWYIDAQYETAWSPCTQLITKISEQFPTLVFQTSFDEESQAYVGCEIFHQGKIYECSYDPFDYDAMPDWIATKIKETRAKAESVEFGSDEFSDSWQDMIDAMNDLKDLAVSQAERLFGEATSVSNA